MGHSDQLWRAAAVLLAFGSPTSLPAQPGPTGAAPARWHLDGATNRCVLSRQLEGTPGAITFVLRTIPGSNRYDIILAGAGIERLIGRGETVRLAFARGFEEAITFEGPASRVDLPGALSRGLSIGPFTHEVSEAFGRATALRLSDREGREIGSWALPITARAAAVVAECQVAKLVDWGADRAGFESGATPPQPITAPRTWLSIRDFGLANALAPATYTAVFRLVLDAGGRPTACTLIEFAGNLDIEPEFCRAIVRSARYRPARDPRGVAIPSVAVEILSFETGVEFRWVG